MAPERACSRPYCSAKPILRNRAEGFSARYSGGKKIPVVYRSASGEIVPVGLGGIVPGDIVHFGAQVSVFLEDRGAPGVLDPDDMLIQSWFDGPHVCTISKSGFYRLPVKLFRWILPE